jgi:MoaA/NifB/PqqE/SkfB family radical SAM enzyme
MVQITTNGWFVDDERAARVFAAGAYMVNVSLDSSKQELHDLGRRNPKAFERAIRAVRTLRDAPKIAKDQLVGFESILSGRNYDEVEEMIRLADELGVKIVFQPYSGGHHGGTLDLLSRIDGDPTERFLDLRASYKSLYNPRPMIERFTPFFRDGRVPDCQAGRTYFNVDAYGFMTRCEEQRHRYGSLLEMTIDEARGQLAEIRRDTRIDGCGSCWLRTRGETEPLYEGDFAHFVDAADEMFDLKLPPLAVKALRSRAARPFLAAGLEVASRLHAI